MERLYAIRVTEGFYCGLHGIEDYSVIYEDLDNDTVREYTQGWGYDLIDEYCSDDYYEDGQWEMTEEPEFYTELYKIKKTNKSVQELNKELFNLGWELFRDTYCEADNPWQGYEEWFED